MRTFSRLREILGSHKDLSRRLDELEKQYDGQFNVVFEAIRELITPPESTKRKIGFELKEKRTGYGGKETDPVKPKNSFYFKIPAFETVNLAGKPEDFNNGGTLIEQFKRTGVQMLKRDA